MAVCIVSRINDSTMEVNNLAVDTPWQRKGFGRTMLQHVEGVYAGHKILIGTGETPENIAFYTACGYSFSHRIPDFFTANYDAYGHCVASDATDVHFPLFEIAVYHTFLLVAEQKEPEKAFFVSGDKLNIHIYSSGR